MQHKRATVFHHPLDRASCLGTLIHEKCPYLCPCWQPNGCSADPKRARLLKASTGLTSKHSSSIVKAYIWLWPCKRMLHRTLVENHKHFMLTKQKSCFSTESNFTKTQQTAGQAEAGKEEGSLMGFFSITASSECYIYAELSKHSMNSKCAVTAKTAIT